MSIFSAYTSFKYIYPPRAECPMRPSLLTGIEEGWIAQPKYNGSCAVLFINGHSDCQVYNRHNEILTLQKSINYTALNDSDRFMVLSGEYLNKNKNGEDGKPFNHKFIVWDILVWQGNYLLDKTVEERIHIMHSLFGTSRGYVTGEGISMYSHLHTTKVEDVFMAPSYLSNFKSLYDEIVQTDLYEGLVLKKADGKLEPGFREKNNTSWQVKVRKSNNSYSF